MFCLLILSWVFALTAVLVKAKLGGSVIFSQKRVGKNQKIFVLRKFRSMTMKTDEKGCLLPDRLRLTGLGRVLRKTSIDELPELINILKGDMSFIGPRPLPVQYLKYYSPTELHRHDVLPGLTGLAQINGRTSLGWNERFALDLEYVNNVSFTNDLRIGLKTVRQLFRFADVDSQFKQGDFDKCRINEQKSEAKNIEESQEVLNGDRK